MRIHGWPPSADEDENVIDARERERAYAEAEPIYWDWRERSIIHDFNEACFKHWSEKRARERAEKKERERLAQLERERTCPEHRWSLGVDFGTIEVLCDDCGMNLFKNEDPDYAILQGWDAVEALAGSVPITVEIEHTGSGGMYGDPREEETYVNIGWRNHPPARKYTPEQEERWLKTALSQA